MNLRSAKLDAAELEKTEDKLLKQWADEVSGFINDGLVDAEKYCLSPIRIMFVLKEVNGGENWDLRKFLRSGARPQTWNVVSRWAEAILNLERDFNWDELSSNDDERRSRVLKNVCVINVKKTSGASVSDNKKVKEAAQAQSENLKKQIELYQPDLVICCGTYLPYVNTMKVLPDWKMTSRGIWYFAEPAGTIVVSFSHPEARIKECLLHYGLIDAVKEILS